MSGRSTSRKYGKGLLLDVLKRSFLSILRKSRLNMDRTLGFFQGIRLRTSSPITPGWRRKLFSFVGKSYNFCMMTPLFLSL